MILQGNIAETNSRGAQSSSLMSIDVADQQALMAILSEGLYKDPVGSVVREWTSNALDAHREIGTEEAVLVSLKPDESKVIWFKVKDVGVGMSPDRQANVINKYAASTKRGDANQLGFFGIGFKSGLSYQNSFMFTTRYDGIEYRYMMYKSEEGSKLDLIYSIPTTERNGTEFAIQVKHGDYYKFVDSVKEQLAYFESVYFEVESVPNDFTILKNENWKHSTLCQDRYIHLCLDNVYYPIDYSKLGIDRIGIPIALNFSTSEGIRPVPSREDIIYTPSVKELILKKIESVANYFVTKYNDSIVEAEDYISLRQTYTGTFADGNLNFSISTLSSKATIPVADPTIKGIEKLNVLALLKKERDFFDNYEVRGQISYKTFYGKHRTSLGNAFFNKNENVKYILVKEKPRGIQLAYLKQVVNHCYFVYKQRDRELGGRPKIYNKGQVHEYVEWRSANEEDYMRLLDLYKYPKEDWRQIIKEFQSIEEGILSRVAKIEEFAPTEEWLKKRKEERVVGDKTIVEVEEINPKWARWADRGWKQVTFEAGNVIKTNILGKTLKGLVVYGKQEDKLNLAMLYKILADKAKIKVCVLADRDIKKIEKISSFIKYEKFMEGGTKPFARAATKFLIESLNSKHTFLFSTYTIQTLGNLKAELKSDIEVLRAYSKIRDFYASEELAQAILTVAEEQGFWDQPIKMVYDRVVNQIPNFKFLESFAHSIDKNQLDLMKDALKFRKVKLDVNCYDKPKVEEVLPVETAIEELELEVA